MKLAPLKLALLLSVSLTAGCALADALSGEDKDPDQGTLPAPDMAQDMATDLAQDMAPDLAPDMDMSADMAPDMAEDMAPDMDVVEGATLARCLDAMDMNGQRCGERGGVCVMRAQGRYTCETREALRGCMERVRLGGISAGLPMTLTTDARGKLHAFGVSSTDNTRWVHFKDIGDSAGLLAESAGRKEPGEIAAIAAIAAPSAGKPAQVAVMTHHSSAAQGAGALSLSVWEGMNSYKHGLSATRDATLPTSSGALTISQEPCAPDSPIYPSAAPPVGDMGGAALTLSTCNRGSNSASQHATIPVRIEDSGVAVWGQAYAPSGYTLEDAGLGKTGLDAPRIWFMSRQSDGALNVRGAEWESSAFAPDGRAMGSGAGFIHTVRPEWLNDCGQSTALVPGARSMVLPHPTQPGRAQLFVATGAGPQVFAWSDMANGMAGGPAPVVVCGQESIQGLAWVDRVTVGSRWLGVGTVESSDVGLMGGTWDLDETAIQRLDLDQPLSAKALATDGSRVWLLAARRADVLLVELTREGAPVCLE